MNSKELEVLERHGFGEDNQTKGRAGVAFDEAVTEKLMRDKKLGIEKDSSRFLKLRNQFEKFKIAESSEITKQLKEFFLDPGMLEGQSLFSLEYNDDGDEVKVCCEDLVDCFNRINAPVLLESLRKIQHFFNAHGVDSTSQENFKVLLVGGFSNFYAVEKAVREFFGARATYEDKRFEQPFELIDRTFAISKGAALIAKDAIKIEHTCPYNIGYIVHARDEHGRLIPKDVIVIAKGVKITDIKAPRFREEIRIQVNHTMGALSIFMDDGRPNKEGRMQAALDQSAKDLFPNVNKKGNEYRIGCSVNRNVIPTLHIKEHTKNQKGEMRSTSLSKLLARIAITEKSR
jgi:hypothetical protein